MHKLEFVTIPATMHCQHIPADILVLIIDFLCAMEIQVEHHMGDTVRDIRQSIMCGLYGRVASSSRVMLLWRNVIIRGPSDPHCSARVSTEVASHVASIRGLISFRTLNIRVLENVVDALRTATTLQHLSLSCVVTGLTCIMRYARHSRSLRSLELGIDTPNANVYLGQMCKWLPTHPTLVNVRLLLRQVEFSVQRRENMDNGDDDDGDRGFRSKCLTVSAGPIRTDVIVCFAIIAGIQELRPSHISLYQIDMSPSVQQVLTMLDAQCDTLESLELHYVQFLPRDWQSLMSHIGAMRYLRRIQLSHVPWSGEPLGHENTVALCDMLSRCSTLCEIHLKQIRVSDPGHFVVMLSETICQISRRLESLHIDLPGEHRTSLSHLIDQCHNVEDLCVSFNQ